MKMQVIQELNDLLNLRLPNRPQSGWIRSIRESIGMTTRQLAKRLGVIQQRASAIELAEKSGTLKMKTLEEVAKALNCRLVYYLVPIEPPEKFLKERAYEVAKRQLSLSTHSMDLESQGISSEEKQRQLKKIADELLVKGSKELWDDE